jgi:hypothetical protein
MIQISTLTHLNCSFIKSDTDRVKDPQKKRKKKKVEPTSISPSPLEKMLWETCSVGNLFSVQELAMPTRRRMDYVTQHKPYTIHPKPFLTQLWIERN